MQYFQVMTGRLQFLHGDEMHSVLNQQCSNLAALRSFVALVSLGKCRTKTEDEDKLMIMHYSDQIFHERYNEKSTLLSWRLCIYSKEPPLTIQVHQIQKSTRVKTWMFKF